MEFEKKVIVDVDGFIESGKQFDLDLRLPEDNRSVVYGVLRDSHGMPVEDAVIKLVEVCQDERKPVSHTFTDKDGEFVFGPLCPDRKYEIQIWVNKVKHVKVCSKCHREGKCLKGVDMKQCDCFIGKQMDDCKFDEKQDCNKKDECK